jgi:integrase/recombinase XerD
MFETLFKYLNVLARHSEGPAAEERRRFLIHRANEGAARNTLRQTANELLVIAKNINATTGKTISNYDLEVAAERWARRQQRKHRSRGPRWSKELFLQVAKSWLRFLGRLQEPVLAPSPFAELINNFAHHMREERGLSEITIRGRCWQAEKLLAWLRSQNRNLADVSVRDVDAFLSCKGGQDEVLPKIRTTH